MFIGRERELSSLEKLYRSDKFEFAVVYGRRRVGKTALLSHFIKDKNSIYFMGIESNAKQNLENFSRSILESDSRNPAESVFLTFQSALEYVFRRSEQERIILVIDEYPYVARSSKSFSSVLQLLIDQYKDRSKLMLILSDRFLFVFLKYIVSATDFMLYSKDVKLQKLSGAFSGFTA